MEWISSGNNAEIIVQFLSLMHDTLFFVEGLKLKLWKDNNVKDKYVNIIIMFLLSLDRDGTWLGSYPLTAK